MKKAAILVLCVLLGLALVSCSTVPKVKRVDVDKKIDLSGRWNDTDSRMVSEEMISDVLDRPWLDNFRSRNGKPPIVIVGTVANRTSEHISMQTFTNDLERSLLNSGLVGFVATRQGRKEVREERQDQAVFSREDTAKRMGEEIGADFMLKGSIDSIIDKISGKAVVFYQINLELIDLESNMKVWIGEKKIKKYVKRPKYVP